jgi:hypothetical protein
MTTSCWNRIASVACLMALAGGLLTTGATALAQFQAFQGNLAVEQAWRSAAGGGGPIPLENFESFQGGPCCSGPADPVQHLSSLRINLYGAVPGTYPAAYEYPPEAHSGVNMIANFGFGGAPFSDYFVEPEPGLAIRALGFWQTDPQGDVVLEAYGPGNVFVGQIIGLINNGSGNSFAAFISDVPILRVRVRGDEGDGLNASDDWQIVTTQYVACYANCDNSITAPILNVADFICFMNKFAALDPYANCDSSTAPPTLNVADFICFMNKYAAGCP